VFLRQQLGREDLLDDVLDAEFFDRRVLDVGRVLRGDDDVGRLATGLVVLIARRKPATSRRGGATATLPALADLRQLAAEAMREHDRRRHQLRRLVARVAKHDALVAGALLGGLLALRRTCVDALRDVGRLLVVR
jgi:hypothetical protein